MILEEAMPGKYCLERRILIWIYIKFLKGVSALYLYIETMRIDRSPSGLSYACRGLSADGWR